MTTLLDLSFQTEIQMMHCILNYWEESLSKLRYVNEVNLPEYLNVFQQDWAPPHFVVPVEKVTGQTDDEVETYVASILLFLGGIWKQKIILPSENLCNKEQKMNADNYTIAEKQIALILIEIKE